MKKYTKFLALMGFALVMSACQEDNIIPEAPALPGDEIIFGATGAFESGDKDTRTIYGDVWENNGNKYIQVKWVPGTDYMDIACPQSATAGAVKNVEYLVASSQSKDSVAVTLQKQGDAGLQWSTAETHHFFASYPSKGMIAKRLKNVISQDEIQQLGTTLDGEVNAKLRGYLPVNQTPSKLPTEQTTRANGKEGWVIEPDMTYAYMVANKSVGTRGNVGLQFTSQMTALEFEIVASDIEQIPNEPAITHEIKILGVTLSHAKKEQIAGHFEYNYAENFFSNVEIAGADAHTNVTQMFPEGLLVDSKTGFVDVTFFVFPGVTFNDGNNDATEDELAKDLELTVLYQIDGVPQNRTAKIRKQIEPKKKYFFADVQLPKIMADGISASNWFNALDDDILVSQVSIPVASNVFANTKYVSGINQYNTQQTNYLKELWNMGVRGFELCNQSSTEEDQSSSTVLAQNLDAEGMVASETVLGFTFKQAIDTLYNCFKGTHEPLVLVCTYASSSDGYNPYHYVANLFNSLQSFCTRNGVDPSTFVQITSSTTTQDIKGKIAVVIRPGDDERWMYETMVHVSNSRGGIDKDITTDPIRMLGGITITGSTNSPYALTKSIDLAENYIERKGNGRLVIGYEESDEEKTTGVLKDNAWWGRVLMISDWGIDSWDNWHRRGGTYYKYATTATNYDKINSASRTLKSTAKYEDLLLASTAPTLSGYYYAHDMSNGSTAYVQNIVRVMPSSITTTINRKSITWPESLIEKKTAVDGLFKESVKTKGQSSDNLYINVLSSYYGTTNHTSSLTPCYDGQNLGNGGKGGDYLSAAKDLTTHTYNLLSGQQNITGETTKLNEGPWGLVMMDYIGDANNADSRKLVNLIMLNNFKFPLATGVPDDGETPVGGGGVQGE